MGTKKLHLRPLAEAHSFRGSLSSEPDELILPGWLNAAKGTKSYDRAVRILDLIRDSGSNLKDIVKQRAYVHTGEGKRPPEHLKLWRISRRLHKELAVALDRYTFDLRLASSLFGQEWLLNIRCNRRKGDFAWEAPYAYKARPGETILAFPTFLVFEGDAVIAAARLAERGLLGQVRLCATCSDRWLFARHSNYRFCSEDCRVKHFTTGDKYRRRKAEQMRVYRRNQKLREESEKRSISS